MGELSILIVGTNNKSTGGVQRYVSTQHENLPASVESAIYDIGAPPGDGLVWFVKSVLLALVDALRFPLQPKPDLVHVHTAQSLAFVRSSYYVFVSRYVWRRPVVLHIHGSSFAEFIETDSTVFELYVRSVFNASDKVIILGDYLLEAMEQYVGPDKIAIIPNAVRSDQFDPTVSTEQPTLIYIADLVERKGVAEMAAAIDSLNDSRPGDFNVELCGKGNLSRTFRDLADRHSNVTYHGYVSEDEKRDLLNNGSIYVLPSHGEGLPIAILEAMAGGNAIVSTTVGSIPEVISEEHGRLVDPGDAAALADALETLVDSPEQCKRLARNNRELVETTYNWDVVGQHLHECYDDLLAST